MTPERRLEILTATRGLIADRRRWGTGTFWQHPIIDRLLMRPATLCLMGAVQIACNGAILWTVEVMDIHEYLLELIDPLERNRSAYGMGMMTWNDHHTHAEVLALLDAAIFATEVAVHIDEFAHAAWSELEPV